MNRLGVVLAILCAGCTDTNYNVFILRNQIIGADCMIPAGGGSVYRGFGTLDVTSPLPGTNILNNGYTFGPAVVNGSTANQAMPNVHTFFMGGADVELVSDGSAQSTALISTLAGRNLDKRTQHFSGAIQAGSTVGVGYPLIDFEQTQALSDVVDEGLLVNIIAHTRIFGTLDGSSVTSDPFDYPIEVCKGCLIEQLGACDTLTSSTTISTGGECNELQDKVLSCCTGATGLVCPAKAPGK